MTEVHIVSLPDRPARDSTTYLFVRSFRADLKIAPRHAACRAIFAITFSTGPFIDTGMLSGYLLTPINAPPMKPS